MEALGNNTDTHTHTLGYMDAYICNVRIDIFASILGLNA